MRPVRSGNERGDHVGKENGSQPFHNHRDLAITKSDCGVGDCDAEDDYVNVRIDSGQHPGCVRHSGKIGADVDRIRD
jgi:hypothetical protein